MTSYHVSQEKPQVVLYKDNLFQKSRQMRAMIQEVKTYQAQVNEYKDEV